MPNKRGGRFSPPMKNALLTYIDDDLNRWLENEVKKGNYESKAHAVREGLRLLRHRSAAMPQGMSSV